MNAIASRQRGEADAWIKETERRLHRERACRKVTVGLGWKILDHPVVSHEELEWRVRRAWDCATLGLMFPVSWRARWARLHGMLGACVPPPYKVILIQENSPSHRSETDLLRTIVHECAHVAIPTDQGKHGPEFARTLREFEWHVFGRLDVSSQPWSRFLPARRSAILAHLTPTASGDRFGFCPNCRRWRTVETASPAPVCPSCSELSTLPRGGGVAADTSCRSHPEDLMTRTRRRLEAIHVD